MNFITKACKCKLILLETPRRRRLYFVAAAIVNRYSVCREFLTIRRLRRGERARRLNTKSDILLAIGLRGGGGFEEGDAGAPGEGLVGLGGGDALGLEGGEEGG